MLEMTGDLFQQSADAVCVTTNGFVKADGEAVMGRGCAREAATLWPGLPRLLGMKLREHGLRTECLSRHGESGPVLELPINPGAGTVHLPYHLVAFPVKPAAGVFAGDNVVSHMRGRFSPGQRIPGWACRADVGIIERSALELVEMAGLKGWDRIIVPRPGCGAGELEWIDVRKVLAGIWDDRFSVITWSYREG